MKKTYIAPEAKEIQVSANQAIAACALRMAGYQNHDKRSIPPYPTEKAAHDIQPDAKSHTAYITAPTYWYDDGKRHFWWEDWDHDNVLGGYWPDNIQDQQGDISDLIGNLNASAVMNS